MFRYAGHYDNPCRDTYAGGYRDSKVLMLDIAAGQAILKAELGVSKTVFNARIVVKLIRGRRERDLKRPKRNELDASVAAGGNQWDSIGRNLREMSSSPPPRGSQMQ